jgi:hypothetical protein
VSEEVSMKKINSKNIMSVKEDILNSALNLVLFFKAMNAIIATLNL